MIRKILIVALLVGIMSLFIGCSLKPDEQNIKEFNNSVAVQDSTPINENLIEKSLYEPYVLKYSASFTQEFDSLQDKGIFDIVRYSKDRYYTVSKLNDGSYFFMLFKEANIYEKPNALILADGFRIKKLIDSESFNEIQLGTSKSKVFELDPFAYFGETCSIHRFSDKTVIMLKYQMDENNNLIVTQIESMNTEDSVLSYLTPQDYNLISKK